MPQDNEGAWNGASQGPERIGAMSAMSGAVLLLIGTYLHPMRADPMDAAAAFAEYAADSLWIATHLTQLLGLVLITGAFVLLAQRMAKGPAAGWAHLGMAGAVASLSAASVLQAVDGIALKVMVDAWASAPDQEKAVLFQTAFGVRQIEIGLVSVTTLLFGATSTVYGIALVVDPRYSKWVGGIGIVSGGAAVAAGILVAYRGFSAVAMAVSMPSSILLVMWIMTVGLSMWPRVESRSELS